MEWKNDEILFPIAQLIPSPFGPTADEEKSINRKVVSEMISRPSGRERPVTIFF